MYTKIFRPLLFRLDPEQAHNLTVQLMRIMGAIAPLRRAVQKIMDAHSHKLSPVEVFGLRFPNPVGLAAGYDKDGFGWRGLTMLGFGHIEVGTVTPLPQSGNPKPRVFRIPENKSLINRMGFPGKGADFVAKNIKRSAFERGKIILGINIGKNKNTPIEDAVGDYLYLQEIFAPRADYLAVNVSSPNTVGLRRLQARKYLENLLGNLNEARHVSAISCPILVKLAPDLIDSELDDALEAITWSGMDGVIATNTTISREGVKSTVASQAGGMSGEALTMRSRRMVSEIHRKTDGKLPIIGVGGIMTPDDAKSMLAVGASLIQVYTGLIYNGPCLVRNIIRAL